MWHLFVFIALRVALKINRIYGGVEAETRKSQFSFQIISLMRGLPSLRLK